MANPVKSKRDHHPIFESVKDYSRTGTVGLYGDRLNPAFVLGIYPPEEHNMPIARGVENAKPFMQALESVSFEEDIYMASMGELTFSDPEFFITNNELISEGTLLDFQFGYGRNTLFAGRRVQIMNSLPEFPENAMPKIQLKGYDGRHFMTLGEHIPVKRHIPLLGPNRRGKNKAPRNFENKTDSEALEMIAFHFGFAADIDRTNKRYTFFKDKNTSYWAFCCKAADRNDYDVWVDWDSALHGWCLHFRKKQQKFKHGYEFEYNKSIGGTLLSFSPNEDLMGQITDLEVISFDTKLKKLSWQTIAETTATNEYRVRTNKSGWKTPYGAQVKFRIGGRTITTISSIPFRNPKGAKEFAKLHILHRQEDYIVGRGTVVGVENLRPRQIHKFTGIGRFSGYYKILQTKHKIYNGSEIYKVDVVCHKLPNESDPVQKTLKELQFLNPQKGEVLI